MNTRILVIDDDEQLRKLLDAFIKELNFKVETATNVPQAIDLIKQNGYDIIITDKNMEGLNGNIEGGMDILRYVNKNLQTTEVIMMTGYASIDTAIEAMKLGAFDYIMKPFELASLEKKISRILQYKKLLKKEGTLLTYKTLHNEILELLKKEHNLNNDELHALLQSVDEKIDKFFSAQNKWSLSWFNIKKDDKSGKN
ncbi:MAG TPA: response regulator [bacterium]|nr:response regulator [bacterium]HPN42669.1 response regulator [bacterium]